MHLTTRSIETKATLIVSGKNLKLLLSGTGRVSGLVAETGVEVLLYFFVIVELHC